MLSSKLACTNLESIIERSYFSDMGPMFWPLYAVEQCPNLRKADMLFGLTSYSKSFRRDIFLRVLRTRRVKPALMPDASACADPNYYWKSCWYSDGQNSVGEDETGTTNNNGSSADAEKNPPPNKHYKMAKTKSKHKVQRTCEYPTWMGMDPEDWKSCWGSDGDAKNPVEVDEAGTTNNRNFVYDGENLTSKKHYIDAYDYLAPPSACISPEKRPSCSYIQNDVLNYQNDAGMSNNKENSIKNRDSVLPNYRKNKSKRKVQRTPDYPTWIGMDANDWLVSYELIF
ncbi:hypothetical protein DdX_18197 [Ditylenchus destructor]|uniref:Uncharacterized protein n=1 Tax=Ditylenchus destructor TaxID=166010 RepID=A0AAD4MMR3_9BILA|nr:hypothetical protein DdX_18197 [Ditylenchus destructor]